MGLRLHHLRPPTADMVGGHGHVTPRPDGAKARCGGPKLCRECARELEMVKFTKATGPDCPHGHDTAVTRCGFCDVLDALAQLQAAIIQAMPGVR